MKPNKDLITLGKHIRKLREARGISQEDFANSIDVSRGYYWTLENGQANITFLNMLKIARGLGIAPSKLFPSELN